LAAPWLGPSALNRTSDSLISLIDVFPTMAALAGVPAPPEYGLEGVDFSSLLLPSTTATGSGEAAAAAASEGGTAAAPAAAPRNYTLSVYPRCPADLSNASLWWRNNDCLMVERSAFPFMGLSLRTERYRYTEWRVWNGSALAPSAGTPPVGVELYDHAGDDGSSFDALYEVVNLAGSPAYAGAQAELAAELRRVYPKWAP
jgi:iduronate 2-sulfatase